jgi:hypothetical protein
MAEYIATAIQTVSARDSVVWTDAIRMCRCGEKRNVFHRPESGTVKLRGLEDRCFTRIRIWFGGNIAVPTGGTVEEISIAIAVDGEPISSSQMLYTPAAVDVYGNVSAFLYVDIPSDCCTNVSVINTSEQDILVQNANLSVTKA